MSQVEGENKCISNRYRVNNVTAKETLNKKILVKTGKAGDKGNGKILACFLFKK